MSRDPALCMVALIIIDQTMGEARKADDWLESLDGIDGYPAAAIDDTIDYVLDILRKRFV